MRVMNKRRSLLLVLGCWVSVLPLSCAQARKLVSPQTPPQGEKLDAQHSILPLVRFECVGRAGGYYGDMDFGCTVFHYCAKSGQRFTFKCTPGLTFNEMTTTCSAGFLGDCTHPEIVGSAGNNKSANPAPVRSFQKVPVFVKEDDDRQDDPRDYPEPFIQHYDPALDLDYNYEYYDTDNAQSVLSDALPAASNRMSHNSNHIKRSSSLWDNDMASALSAFASLANVPYDNPAPAREDRVDRSDNFGRVDYVDTIDRAFIARPPRRRRPAQRQSTSHFFQLPFFQAREKKPVRVVPPRGPGQREKFIHTQQQSPYRPLPPADNYEASSGFRSPHQEYQPDSSFVAHQDSFSSPEERQTTPDSFRPSSILTDDPDDFQPVTSASKQSSLLELSDLVRPNRDANHQAGHSSLSTSFQSFSPSPQPFSSGGRVPVQTSFGSHTSPRHSPTTPSSFLPGPSFPSNGNFVFNQPPVHPGIFTRPSHHIPSTSRNIFGAPPAPRQQVDSFGHQSSSQQPVQRFTHQPAPNSVTTFGHQPTQSHSPGSSSVISFNQPSAPHSGQSFSQASASHLGQRFSQSSAPHSGQSFGQPSALHSGQSFSQPSAFHSGQSFNQPSAPHSGQGFSQSPAPHSGQRFNHASVFRPGQSFSQSSNLPPPGQTFRQPTSSPKHIKNFGPPTVPPTDTNFGRLSPSVSFFHPATQQRPVHSFGKPTPLPFISQTPAPVEVPSHFTPGFQQDHTISQHFQHPFQDSTEAPSSAVSTFPHTEKTSSIEEASQSPQSSSGVKDFPFRRTSTTSGVSESPSVVNDFDSGKTEEHQTEEDPQTQPTGRLSFDPRPTNRRRPIENQQRRQQPARRRPTRPRRPTTQPPFTESTLITGLENSEFNKPFLTPHGVWPAITRLQPRPVTEETSEEPFIVTTPFPTPVTPAFSRVPGFSNQEEPGTFQPPAGIFDPTLVPARPTHDPHHLDDDAHVQADIPPPNFDENLPSIINAVESLEEETNVILSGESDYTGDREVLETVTESTPLTTTPEPSTEAKRPFTRRRPNIRTRLRPRISSRKTTPAPVADEAETPAEEEYDAFEDSPETDDAPVTTEAPQHTTTLSPFRQRLQDRLNRLKNRRQNPNRVTTTKRPESSNDTPNITTTTTATAARRRPSRRHYNLNPERFRKYRNRVRGITTTAEDSGSDGESTTTEKPADADDSFTSNLRSRRINRFRPKAIEPEDDNVLQVKEILRRDQDVQETIQSVVHKKPNFNQEQSSSSETRTIEEQPDEIIETAEQTSVYLPQAPQDNVDDAGEVGQNTPPESPDNIDEDDQDSLVTPGAETRRMVINPNFRARFREFLKNRKNRLSASYRTTESPDTVNDDAKETADNSEKEEQEPSNPIFPDRSQQIGQHIRDLRAKFLNNRQQSEEERLSRRIPARPLRNKISGETQAELQAETDTEPKEVAEEENLTRESPLNFEKLETDTQDTEEIYETPQPKGTEPEESTAFKPIFSPSTSATQPSPAPLRHHQQEPDIITAPPSSKDGDVVMSFKVSANLAGDPEESHGEAREESESQDSKISPPSEMIVREIGIDSSLPQDEEEPKVKDLQTDTLEDDSHSLHIESISHKSAQEVSESPQEAAELQETPVLISIQSPAPESSNTAVPRLDLHSPAPTMSARVSYEDFDSDDAAKPPVPRVSKPTFHLGSAIGRPKKVESSAVSASDSRNALTPTPFPSITMATDPPRLPLEMLLPLFNNRR